MGFLWVLAAVLIAAAGVSLLVTGNTKIAMILVIAGSAVSLIDQYRNRRA